MIRSVEELDLAPRGEVFPSPLDWRDQFIYFLLVDRFDNNQSYIPPYNPSFTPRGRDPREGALFQGGNLRGVARRLDYIKNLGCSAIWLSPIFKNRQEKKDTYHGYGIQDFLQVDPRFGTLEDLQELVKAAHRRGIYVILDVVIDHTGDNWAYLRDEKKSYHPLRPYTFGFWRKGHPSFGFKEDDGIWPRELQNPRYYKRRGRIRSWDGPAEELEGGDFYYLKKLDLDQLQPLEIMIKIYKYWISATDVDGFRLDAAKHVGPRATAVFCTAVKEYAQRLGKSNFLLVGEVAGDDDVLRQFLCRRIYVPEMDDCLLVLDAALDFPLSKTLEGVIKGLEEPLELQERYERLKSFGPWEMESHLVTFLDNHDRKERFMHGGATPEQAISAMAYLLTSPGVPCIYYGTEQGFDGGGTADYHVRECMFGGKWGAFNTTGVHFFQEENPIYQGIRAVAKIRSEEPALRYGRMRFREISEDGLSLDYPARGLGTLAFSRILDSEEVLVAINLSPTARADFVAVDKRITPPGSRMSFLFNGTGFAEVQGAYGRAFVQVPLGGYQTAILKNQALW